MQFSVNDIPVRVERKRIRNLHLYVKPPYGEVVVTAPNYTSDRTIQRFLDSRSDWVAANVAKFQRSPVTQNPDFTDGEVFPLWGDIYPLQTVSGAKKRIALVGEEEGDPYLQMTLRGEPDREARRRVLVEFYRGELKERTEVLLPQWEQYTDLHCSAWTTRFMMSRWGSCNTQTKKITLNVQLARHPEECLSYVILHELCHTVVPNHGPAFKALESKYMPDWPRVRRELNRMDSDVPIW